MTNDVAPLVFNTRFQYQELTGVQRYGYEMTARLAGKFEAIRPSRKLSNIKGHLWEQAILPQHCRGRLLWCPGNTGPLQVSRQVVTMHDASTLDHPEWFSGMFSKWYRFLLPRLAKRVRKVITVSEFSRQRLIETCGIPAERVVAIHNGIDARFQPSSSDQVKIFRATQQLERPYLLYLGSLEPRKNLTALLEAWKKLQRKDVDLVVAGAAGHVFRNRGFTTLPSGVRLYGRVAEEDLLVLLSGAVGFVFPSLYEGFGFPALEALACGCPALVSNTTSLPEVSGPAFDPETGSGTALYFDPLDIDQLVECMRQILGLDSDRRELLVRNGRAHAATFTWERTVHLTWDVLEAEMSPS